MWKSTLPYYVPPSSKKIEFSCGSIRVMMGLTLSDFVREDEHAAGFQFFAAHDLLECFLDGIFSGILQWVVVIAAENEKKAVFAGGIFGEEMEEIHQFCQIGVGELLNKGGIEDP